MKSTIETVTEDHSGQYEEQKMNELRDKTKLMPRAPREKRLSQSRKHVLREKILNKQRERKLVALTRSYRWDLD